MVNTRWIDNILYALHKDFGRKLDLYRTTTSETNVDTGKVTRQRSVFHVRAIVLPANSFRRLLNPQMFSKDSPSANYGGEDDLERLPFIVWNKHCKIEIQQSDSVIDHGQRYQIKTIERLEGNVGYLVISQLIKGMIPYEIFELKVEDRLDIVQEVVNEL